MELTGGDLPSPPALGIRGEHLGPLCWVRRYPGEREKMEEEADGTRPDGVGQGEETTTRFAFTKGGNSTSYFSRWSLLPSPSTTPLTRLQGIHTSTLHSF